MKRTGVLLMMLFMGSAGLACAQAWPARPVRVIIAFPPGSAVDIVGRLFATRLAEAWAQPAVVDNRAGAGGSIAAGLAARSAPDGYTRLLHSSGHAVNPSIYAKLPYDPVKSFVEIGPLAQQPNVLVVNPASPWRTVADVIKAARSKPGQVTIASAGVGSGTHLNLEKFKFDGKLDVNQVPYKGSSEALVDVMGGRVDGFFSPISAGLEHIRSGKVRALAASTAKRSSLLPDVPSIAEAALPGFQSALWFGMWAPAGPPAPIVERIATDRRRAGVDLREKLAALGNEPMEMTPAQFAAFVREEIETYAVLLRAAGIKPQ
ncbi:MAG: Bug family tripartite tricarboxylate transporter substrate binding protein [bacterium]